jgi:hypothetical protein
MTLLSVACQQVGITSEGRYPLIVDTLIVGS